MNSLEFRSAGLSDLAQIVEFQLAMAIETENLRLDPAVCTAGVHAAFADQSRGQYFVGVCDRQIVASLMVTPEWSDWRNGTVWWIQSVYVVPQKRGQGIFSGLYRHVQQLAQSNPGVRGLRLYVDKRNARAQQVYARLGMNGDHYQVFEWMK